MMTAQSLSIVLAPNLISRKVSASSPTVHYTHALMGHSHDDDDLMLLTLFIPSLCT